MITNNIRTHVTGNIRMKLGEWKYITSEIFASRLKTETLIWKTLDPHIVQINPNSGLLYAYDVGTATVYATDINETSLKAFCTIEIKEDETFVQSKSNISTRCCDDGNCEISALGYSGKSYKYIRRNGTYITLDIGLQAKNGTSNWISDAYHNKIIQMKNLYANLSASQKEAWLYLRLQNFLTGVLDLLISSPIDIAVDILKEQLLEAAGIDLGGLWEATINGFYDWYILENQTKSLFDQYPIA